MFNRETESALDKALIKALTEKIKILEAMNSALTSIKRPKIELFTAEEGDWFSVYFNGNLADAGHHLNTEVLLMNIGCEFSVTINKSGTREG